LCFDVQDGVMEVCELVRGLEKVEGEGKEAAAIV
jgi:hypothetical protein